MGNMDSLTVLRAEDVTGITRSPSTTQNVRAWYSFIWPSPLKPIKNPETSWASYLPRSLVKLSLVSCNLSDDAFPTDFNSLSSLQELDLSYNPITSLPDCVRGLTGLRRLNVCYCPRLRSLVVQQNLFGCLSMFNRSLEKVTILPPAFAKRSSVKRHRLLNKETFLSPAFTSEYDLFQFWKEPIFCCFGSHKLVEISGIFKMEPIGNVDKSITNNLGLFDLESMGNLKVKLLIPQNSVQKLYLQGFQEEHVFYTYLPGSKVPGWINLTNKGSSLSFTAPYHNSRIRGLSLCIVYACSSYYNRDDWIDYGPVGPHLNTVISNATKRLIWSHCPQATGIPEAKEDMIWLSYWKFENQVAGGEELNISVFTTEGFEVKEVGVHLVYSGEKAEKITQQNLPTSELVSGEIERYGVAVPGNASSYHENTQVFALGPPHLDVIKTIQCGRVTLIDIPGPFSEEETIDRA